MPRLVGGAAWGNIAWHRPDWTPKSRNYNACTKRTAIQVRKDKKDAPPLLFPPPLRVAIDPSQSEPTKDKLIGICISVDHSSLVNVSPMKTNRYR